LINLYSIIFSVLLNLLLFVLYLYLIPLIHFKISFNL